MSDDMRAFGWTCARGHRGVREYYPPDVCPHPFLPFQYPGYCGAAIVDIVVLVPSDHRFLPAPRIAREYRCTGCGGQDAGPVSFAHAQPCSHGCGGTMVTSDLIPA